jgi:hypothetical protein
MIHESVGLANYTIWGCQNTILYHSLNIQQNRIRMPSFPCACRICCRGAVNDVPALLPPRMMPCTTWIMRHQHRAARLKLTHSSFMLAGLIAGRKRPLPKLAISVRTSGQQKMLTKGAKHTFTDSSLHGKRPMPDSISTVFETWVPGKGSAGAGVQRGRLARAPGASGAAGMGQEAEKVKEVRQQKKASYRSTEEADKVIREAHLQGVLAKVGMVDLRAFLKAQGKPLGGKKVELVNRVQGLLA